MTSGSRARRSARRRSRWTSSRSPTASRRSPTCARDGEHAGAARPDLILLDLNLPKKNGLEVLEEIRRDAELRRVPVIMLTTSSSARDIAACYDRGVNCYVVKPLDLDDFTALVQAINRFWFEVARLPPR